MSSVKTLLDAVEGNIHYYINEPKIWFDRKGKEETRLFISYKVMARHLVGRKKALLGWRDEYEECLVEHAMPIPLLLFGDGEVFYEFFSKQLFGEIATVETGELEDFKFGPTSGVPISHPLCEFVKTKHWQREEFGSNTWYSTIKECTAMDFLSEVNHVKEKLLQVGLGEQELKEQIIEIFAQAKRTYEENQVLEKPENQRTKEDRDNRDGQAHQILKEMLKK